ncbi:MAG: sugar transferase [Actinomycetota bacterium]
MSEHLAVRALRRTLDITAALVVLVIGAPLLVALALAVRVTLGSPVLFRQRRLGRGGTTFELWKFRTMREAQPGHDDPYHDGERLTRFGTALRTTSLDELPQAVNLLRGDITLVGPRPLLVRYWPRFRGDEYQRFQVKPGITGLAQVHGRNRLDWDERLAMDVKYVRTRTLRGDLRLLADTVPVVLSRTGVNRADGVPMHELPEERRV